MHRNAGFTLLEMLVSLALVAILTGFVAAHSAKALHLSQSGYERDILCDQLDAALDLIEDDVRRARDVDRATWQRMGNDLSLLTASPALYLLTADESDPAADARVSYTVSVPGGDMSLRRNPADRPRARTVLYRADTGGNKAGKREPVTLHINSVGATPTGLSVHYCDAAGTPCTLSEEVALLEVVLSAADKSGEVTQRQRIIPLGNRQKGDS